MRWISLNAAVLFALAATCIQGAGVAHAAGPGEIEVGGASILSAFKIAQARKPDTVLGGTRIWQLTATPNQRAVLIEIQGQLPAQIHPDAVHNLYVVDGTMTGTIGDQAVTASSGDYIVIPANTSNGWAVAPGKKVLLLSVDAPPFDPAKTIWPGGQRPAAGR